MLEHLKQNGVSNQTSIVIDEDDHNKSQLPLGAELKNFDLQEKKILIEIACGCIRKQLPSETMHAVLLLCSTLTRTHSVAVGKHHKSSFSKGVNDDPVSVESEEGILQRIMEYENTAAAILCKLKCDSEAQVSDHSLTKDVLGFVATLGKVDDANLSRILSEYMGLETMLGVVCKTYEGVKALEAYNIYGSINKGFGVHAVAALAGWHLEKRFLVFCLENLRPYTGAVKADNPQRRLDIPKPRLARGETPPGFLGFAVNMVAIDSSNLHFNSKNGYSLRETLFYNLFSDLQVYRSREEMLKALSYIPHGSISLDGGVIRSPAIFSLGHDRGDIDVKFPSNSKKSLITLRRAKMKSRDKVEERPSFGRYAERADIVRPCKVQL